MCYIVLIYLDRLFAVADGKTESEGPYKLGDCMSLPADAVAENYLESEEAARDTASSESEESSAEENLESEEVN